MPLKLSKAKVTAGLAVVVALVIIATSSAIWWATRSLALKSASVDFYIPRGTGIRAAAQLMVGAGIETDALWLGAYLHFGALGRTIKAGEYEIGRGTTPAELLGKLIRGERRIRSVTLIEGWTFAQVRGELDRLPYLDHDTAGMSGAAIMAALGRAGVSPEGCFFPDTYNYTRGESELALLREAMRMMDQRLAEAWKKRDPNLPLKSPEEALILASIIEKETGRPADRAEVAGVFVNRLRKGMPLQTDPTVIYGLGQQFDGHLNRGDLQTNTPFNTYVNHGLPPTPISMPGEAALMAAVRPAQTSALYFVARGDGSSQFSDSLAEHNKAVMKYQRNGKSGGK